MAFWLERFVAVANSDGRVSRKQWWLTSVKIYLAVLLAAILAWLVYAMLLMLTQIPILGVVAFILIVVFTLVLIVCAIAACVFHLMLTVGRCHDAGVSGWFLLIGFIPFIGPLVVLITLGLVRSGERNRWGPPL